MIDVRDLLVLFGGVRPLDDLTISIPDGRCGLIGPNGAGKTTLLNVLSGFVRPVKGHVTVFGTDLTKMTDYQRARWGLRRTFQTEQAIAALTVFENVLTVSEHTHKIRIAARRGSVLDAVNFVGLEGKADDKVGSLSPRDRRLVEMARAVVGEPRLLLLDEPGAGLPESETEQLGRLIHSIPDYNGAMVVLVEHDMSLVQMCCEWTAVLDFGSLLASGATEDVLHDPLVLTAYLGDEVI